MEFSAQPQIQLVKWMLRVIFLTMLVSLAACQPSSQPEQVSDSAPVSKVENRLVLNNATLEQANSQGQAQWKIKAERAIYSQDQKTARLEKITANVFKDGKLILQVSGNRGRVEEDGEQFFLEEQVIASDPRNGAVIRCDEVAWSPKENVLVVRQNLTGRYQDLEVSAKEGRYFSIEQRLELNGAIQGTLKDPSLQIKTEHLVWELPQQKVSSDRVTRLVQFENKTVTSQAITDRVNIDLARRIALMQKNVELKSVEPPVTIAANSVAWNYQERILSSQEPVQIIDRQKSITVTGNRGQVDLKREVAHLQGGVQGKSDRRQAQLYANELIWQLPTQTVEAIGNVVYKQTDPPSSLTGARAVGKLQNNSMVVSSSKGDRVVTRIVP